MGHRCSLTDPTRPRENCVPSRKSHFGVDVGDGSARRVLHAVAVDVVGGEATLLQIDDVGAREHHEERLECAGKNHSDNQIKTIF